MIIKNRESVKKRKKKLGTQLLFIFISCIFTGCSPRGETKSLDQVLEGAKQRFEMTLANAGSSGVDAKIAQDLQILASSLKSMLEREGVRASSAENMASTLSDLIPHTSYTTRTALTELVKQYRTLVEHAKDGQAIEAQDRLAPYKLIAARTYDLLAAELKATKFSL